MNLWIRLLWLLLSAAFRPVLKLPHDASVIRTRVWPNDLDTNWHMNNGRYFTIMDLGRFDLLSRAGAWAKMSRKKWGPVLGAATIRYRQPLEVFEPFDLETRVLCWDERWVYIEQRFIIGHGPKAGGVAAIGLVRAGFIDETRRRMVPMADAADILGISGLSPVEPAHITEWKRAEAALKEVTA